MVKLRVAISEQRDASYDIVIGRGLLADLPAFVKAACPAGRYVVITDSHVAKLYRSEEHTSELQSRRDIVCRFLLAKKKLYLLRSTRYYVIINKTSDRRTITMNESGFRAKVFLYTSLYMVVYFNVTVTTCSYTRSLHGALPI